MKQCALLGKAVDEAAAVLAEVGGSQQAPCKLAGCPCMFCFVDQVQKGLVAVGSSDVGAKLDEAWRAYVGAQLDLEGAMHSIRFKMHGKKAHSCVLCGKPTTLQCECREGVWLCGEACLARPWKAGHKTCCPGAPPAAPTGSEPARPTGSEPTRPTG